MARVEWCAVPFDKYLAARRPGWSIAERDGDVRFNGDLVLVHPERAEGIVRVLCPDPATRPRIERVAPAPEAPVADPIPVSGIVLLVVSLAAFAWALATGHTKTALVFGVIAGRALLWVAARL
jgi:hypothetical protein